jgi:hypothetical protein
MTSPAPAPLERCFNCDATIGRLETPMLFQEQIVCATCHAKLAVPIAKPAAARTEPEDDFAAYVGSDPAASASSPANGPDAIALEYQRQAVAALSPETARKYMRAGPNDIICPNVNCGYKGPGDKRANGSRIVLIFLLLFFVLPGILYLFFARGYSICCPRCKMKVRSAGMI